MNNMEVYNDVLIKYGLISKIIGSLFYYRPCDYSNKGMFAIVNIKSNDENNDELTGELLLLLNEFSISNIESLISTHDEYFMGIGSMPLPPWGSVYLDRESVIFGLSMQEFKTFISRVGIEFETNNNDPLDHIGLMFMALGELLDIQQQQPAMEEINELLSCHLLPWSQYYIDQLCALLKTEQSTTSAYFLLAEFTRKFQQQLIEEFNINIDKKQIFKY
ncbi:hypothetical protein C0W35_02660 [Photobacterium kishitanii]|uniref:Molecular chaperone n=2 Tax=Photobacterium kishitanii TaxID=318456 RepID=A0A2T3KND4_9GAMM|nr:hypothetical protein C0W35_02660 [Photobacterium kishitanii]PSV01586.1 hypothetical protein C9J27_00545 [Photobacterium kishitanii]